MEAKKFKIGKNEFEFTHTHTLGVLGGAYADQSLKALRTHLVFCNGDSQVRVACRQPIENLVDEHGAEDINARPSCPTCAKKWDRLYGVPA